MTFLHILKILVSLIIFISSGKAAQNKKDTCDYYNKLESRLKCGNESYIHEFARPYCLAFLDRKSEFSKEGQIILKNIRQCLQQVLRRSKNQLTCDNIEEIGLKSHEECYKAHGFCLLKPLDFMGIFWIARQEVFNPKIWILLTKAEKECLSTQ